MTTIKDLEAASDAADAAHDKAVARYNALHAIAAAFVALDDAICSPALAGGSVVDPLFAHSCAAPHLAVLKEIRLAGEEVDRLETACHEAADALNAAPEEAA